MYRYPYKSIIYYTPIKKLHPKDIGLDDSDDFDESVGYVIDEIDG